MYRSSLIRLGVLVQWLCLYGALCLLVSCRSSVVSAGCCPGLDANVPFGSLPLHQDSAGSVLLAGLAHMGRVECPVPLLHGSVIDSSTFRGEEHRALLHHRPDMSRGLVFISKRHFRLSLLDAHGQTVLTFPIACGKVSGQKRRVGDYRTPEGQFVITEIIDSRQWCHDFGDGKGVIPHAYGPWFIRLRTGFHGIGIHGTHLPESIGTRDTEGCVRLANDDLRMLQPLLHVGMPVIIAPDPAESFSQ